MFDSLAYNYLILRSFEICNFRNMGVYVHFKTVDLSSLKFHYLHKTKYIRESGIRPNFSIDDNGNVYIVFNFNFSGRRECYGGAYQVLIIKQCKELINCC